MRKKFVILLALLVFCAGFGVATVLFVAFGTVRVRHQLAFPNSTLEEDMQRYMLGETAEEFSERTARECGYASAKDLWWALARATEANIPLGEWEKMHPP